MILYPLVQYVRKNFQWFITPQDECPNIDKKGLEKFLKHGYDAELGWVRHPGTSKEKEQYRINKKGARMNLLHEALPIVTSSYGDSFCFCRQNKDNETWQWHLSDLTKSNVQNFGVGNYGLDQAFLRLKREYPSNKTKTVIICIVPSTIVRILCVWKHYNEYGNVLGFKPRFKLEGDKLKLVKNIIDSPDKFDDLEKYLPFIQENDYFYKTKFKKEIIRFPYIYYILKNPLRNLPLIYYVLMGKKEKALMKIMNINLKLRIKLFKRKEATDLFLHIVKMFVEYAKDKKFKPILLVIPQKDDVEYIMKHNHYYRGILQDIDGELPVIDMYNLFKEQDLDVIYSDDNKYGGHPNNEGNKIISVEMKKKLW